MDDDDRQWDETNWDDNEDEGILGWDSRGTSFQRGSLVQGLASARTSTAPVVDESTTDESHGVPPTQQLSQVSTKLQVLIRANSFLDPRPV